MCQEPVPPISNKEHTSPGAAERAWVERWLSPERFAPYLAACDDDTERALNLYEWNASLAQALMRDICHFEIALRNAYDRVMGESWEGDWLLDDASPARVPLMRKSGRGELDANYMNRRIIDGAAAGLPKEFPHGALVASLTLGFWVHLTDRSRETVIWRTHLYRAWPKGTRRKDLQRSLNRILRIRNRAAHAERLFNPSNTELSPLSAASDAMRMLGDLCPEAAKRLYGDGGTTPVELFCKDNPAPAYVSL